VIHNNSSVIDRQTIRAHQDGLLTKLHALVAPHTETSLVARFAVNALLRVLAYSCSALIAASDANGVASGRDLVAPNHKRVAVVAIEPSALLAAHTAKAQHLLKTILDECFDRFQGAVAHSSTNSDCNAIPSCTLESSSVALFQRATRLVCGSTLQPIALTLLLGARRASELEAVQLLWTMLRLVDFKPARALIAARVELIGRLLDMTMPPALQDDDETAITVSSDAEYILASRVLRRTLPFVPRVALAALGKSSPKSIIDNALRAIGADATVALRVESPPAQMVVQGGAELVALVRSLMSAFTLTSTAAASAELSSSASMRAAALNAEHASDTIDWLPVIAERVRHHVGSLAMLGSATLADLEQFDDVALGLVGALDVLGGVCPIECTKFCI
jgi:hypothetical protein